MNPIKKVKLLIVSCCLLLIAAGCAKFTSDFSPEQVISNALAESENAQLSYIGIAKMIVYENGQVVEEQHLKEWVASDGRIRIESDSSNGGEAVIAINNGSEILTYLPDENEVLFFDEPELFEFNAPSPKEQAIALLERTQETHRLEVKGENEVAGRMTFHIKAEPKESGLYGKQDLWIDKQNWMILKTISYIGNERLEMSYEQIEFNPDIEDEIFQLELNEDVERIDINDLGDTEEISLEDDAEKLGKSFLFFPEQDDLEIQIIEVDTVQLDDRERIEINFEYMWEGLPAFSIGVFEQTEDLFENDSNLEGEIVTVRDQKGLYLDAYGFRSIVWDEDGLRYSVIFNDRNFTLEQFLQLAETMELLE